MWETVEDLKNYIYNGDHLSIFVRKKEWFVPLKTAHLVLWFVKEGHKPTAEEGKIKLDILIDKGPTSEAFGFRNIPDKAV